MNLNIDEFLDFEKKYVQKWRYGKAARALAKFLLELSNRKSSVKKEALVKYFWKKGFNPRSVRTVLYRWAKKNIIREFKEGGMRYIDLKNIDKSFLSELANSVENE